MSRQYIEATGSSVGGPSCSYATLSHYNNGGKGAQLPVPKGGTVTGAYIVPSYSSPGYDTFSHGSSVPSCSGYFDIGDAYKSKGGDCNQKYVRKLCQ